MFGYQHGADAEAALTEGLAIDAAILDFDLRDQETGLEFISRMSADLESFHSRRYPVGRHRLCYTWRLLPSPEDRG